MRKPAFCICENKDADRKADQRLCFRYTDSTIPLLPKTEISSLATFSDWTAWFVSDLVENLEDRSTLKTGFLRTRLICSTILRQRLRK